MSSIPLASYNVVIDRFRAFAEGHHMINAFSHGSLSLVDLPKDQEYPCMHVVPGEVIINKGLRQYTFDIVFFDRPRSKEEEPEYQREVISDCIRLAEDLIYEVYHGTVLFGEDVQMTGQYSITPFVEYYAQVVTGATLGSFSLIFPNDWNACDIPATYAPGGSGSGGSGSGSGGITLRVNGTNNAVQNILDLVQGTNIVIEDLGDGQVRIRATGGGGGGADWGGIGGDIDDQTDLIERLDAIIDSVTAEAAARVAGDAANASAISAEATARAAADTALQGNIDAEASTRASADTTLQNNIDILDGELSTETTARLAGDATNAADIAAVQSNLDTHEADTNNPHSVTKTQVGLSNVPNVDATTTANITDSTNKRFVTDANLTKINAIDQSVSSAEKSTWNAKEPAISSGTTAQYWRGDKTWQTLDKSSVGLGNVDNTSDVSKPVSTAQATAIALKQDTLVSGTNIKTINGASILGSGDLVVGATQAIRATATAVTLTASSGDRFLTLTGFLNSGTEGPAQIAAESAMTFTKLVVRITSTQSATGSLVFTLRKNGVDTAIVLTIAAGSTANTYTATGSVAFATGDLISIKARNNATATSANIVQMSNVYTA